MNCSHSGFFKINFGINGIQLFRLTGIEFMAMSKLKSEGNLIVSISGLVKLLLNHLDQLVQLVKNVF